MRPQIARTSRLVHSGSTMLTHVPAMRPTCRQIGLNHSECNVRRTDQWGTWVQTGDRVRILQQFVWYTGASILASSIAALTVRLRLPESSHMQLFILVHSLCIGMALMLLIRSGGGKTGLP